MPFLTCLEAPEGSSRGGVGDPAPFSSQNPPAAIRSRLQANPMGRSGLGSTPPILIVKMGGGGPQYRRWACQVHFPLKIDEK